MYKSGWDGSEDNNIETRNDAAGVLSDYIGQG